MDCWWKFIAGQPNLFLYMIPDINKENEEKLNQS